MATINVAVIVLFKQFTQLKGGHQVANEKKKGSGFDLDSIIAGYGLRIIKSVVRKGLPKLMALNKQLYLQLCVLFRTGDPADREIVEGSARVAVEVLDTIFDKLPFVPQAVKSMFDDFGGDLITEVRDHFAHVNVEIPTDLPKLEGDEALKHAGNELAKFLHNLLLAAGERLKGLAGFLSHLGISVDERGDLIDLLLQLDELDDFMIWYNGQTDEVKGCVRRHAKLINDPNKYAAWKMLPDVERAEFFTAADDFLKAEAPYPVKKAFEAVKGEFGKAAESARSANLKLDPSYRERPDWKVEHFSAANLKKFPHRHDMLPANDARREAYERRKTVNGRIRTGLLIVAAIIAYGLMTGTFQKAWVNMEAYLGWMMVGGSLIFVAAIVALGVMLIGHIKQKDGRSDDAR